MALRVQREALRLPSFWELVITWLLVSALFTQFSCANISDSQRELLELGFLCTASTLDILQLPPEIARTPQSSIPAPPTGGLRTTMNIQSAINKEVFIPRNERMLVAVEVRRRKRKRMSFLTAGAKGDYATFICVSVTNTRPHQLLITKVKQFGGSSSFTRRSQWTVEQLRQVNGINPNKDSPEFDLVFDSSVDQWVASSSAEKCIFIQILYHACQTYWEGKAESLGKTGKLGKVGHRGGKASQSTYQEVRAGPSDSPQDSAPRTLQARRKSHVPPRQTEFINCQSKLTGDACTMNLVIYRCKAFLNRMKNMMITNQKLPGGDQLRQRVTGSTMGNIVRRVNVSLGERGDKLTRAEDRTVELMHKAQQFADTAHKLALKYSK